MVRKHKYNATKTVVDGITFASKAEAKRYAELKLLEKAKKISSLVVQPEFDLNAVVTIQPLNDLAGIKLGKYVADFSYDDDEKGGLVVEDVKGFKTPLYRWKKKHVEAQYGIKIVEIK